jgi:hypothetical protein
LLSQRFLEVLWLGSEEQSRDAAGSHSFASSDGDDIPPELAASLQLSLDRLDEAARNVNGVRGGASSNLAVPTNFKPLK